MLNKLFLFQRKFFENKTTEERNIHSELFSGLPSDGSDSPSRRTHSSSKVPVGSIS